MAVIELVPTASGDDGYVYSGVFNNSGNDLRWGSVAGLATPIHSFIRFPNVTIPSGSIINDVKIYRKVYSNSSDNNVNIMLYFNNVDDSVAPTSEASFNALALTAGLGVGLLPAETADTTGYLYNDLGDGYLAYDLQTVIDREGWESGNALMLIIKDDSSTAHAYRSAYSKDGDSSNPVKLIIDYTAVVETPVVGNRYALPAFRRSS